MRLRDFELFEVVIITITVGLIGCIFYVAYIDAKNKYSQESYLAWCQLERRYDIDYQTWQQLIRSGAINKQPETTVIPIVIPTGR